MTAGTRNTLLAATLLFAGPAVAAPPQQGHYVWVPAGFTVVQVPIASFAQFDFPAERMITQQQVMMQRVMADMDSMLAMPIPVPAQMIRSVPQGLPMSGSGVVVASISTNAGTCSQTITYGSGGQVQVSSTGNACGMLGTPSSLGVTQPLPVPASAPPRPERIWNVDYPAHQVTIGKPRT